MDDDRPIPSWDNIPYSLHPREFDWAHERREEKLEPLSDEFGRDLLTLDRTIEWLSHPDNWFYNKLDIVKWNGVIPHLSFSHAYRIAPTSLERRELAEIVLIEQHRRKGRLKREVPSESS